MTTALVLLGFIVLSIAGGVATAVIRAARIRKDTNGSNTHSDRL